MVPTTGTAFTRAVADVVAHWVRRNPDLLARLGRAHQLILTGAVSADPSRQCHQVRSAREPGLVYAVSLFGRSCDCPDHVDAGAPRGWCKHLLAVAAGGAAMRLLARRGLAVGELGDAATYWRWLVTQQEAA